MRASAGLGHTGRPAALCAPRCVARRATKKLARSAADALAMSSTLGCPGATVAPQPQYSSSRPFGRSVDCSTTLSSSSTGADRGASRGACSFSPGFRKPGGTACCASASDGLLRV